MKKTLILLFITPLLAFSTHKYYLALTEIEYNKKTKAVQMIMNVFMDDIEVALNHEYQLNLQIASNNEPKDIEKYYTNYLKKHFKILINNQEKNYRFIGKEYEGNIVYFYLEIPQIHTIESIEVQNTILIKQFSEQQNLIKVTIDNTRKSLFLDKENDKGLLKF